ncbi:dihydroneopterin aldolase [Syntrophomonas erecta]
MDSIIARGLRFTGCHGVLPEEKVTPQPFVVDLQMFLDLQAAGENDDLDKTVSYDQVYKKVRHLVENNSYQLIEALAENIARVVLQFNLIHEVEVTVYKPEAPVNGDFDYFAVNIRRSRR